MKRIRAVMLVVLLIMMTAIPVFNVASADETEPTETTSVTANNDEQKENYVFVNKLKKGNLDVTKTAEDGLVEGFKFHLTGTSMSGQPIDLTATTGKDGIAHFKDIPIGTDFKLNEIEIPDRYVTPDEQTVVIEYNKLTQATMHNTLKKGSVQLIKVDSKNPDKKLSGAEFAVYKDTNGDGVYADTDELIGYMEEVSKGVYFYDNLPYGNYFVNETKAPEGYNLDPAFYGFVINSEDTVTVQNKDGVFVNEKIPQPTTQPTTPPDAPQTGQKSYVVPLLIIIILSVGVIIFFIIRNKKKNK
mgnify:CR=1 FL=1